jgi:hypothetical protein
MTLPGTLTALNSANISGPRIERILELASLPPTDFLTLLGN